MATVRAVKVRTRVQHLTMIAALVVAAGAAPAAAEVLDLERLDVPTAEKMMQEGKLTSVKLGLSEVANSFGNQPSVFSNLTGQVLNAVDADQNPSGSSSGSGAAGASALSMLTIGTETSGSIISPSTAQGLVGIRPTVGLVPGYGIAPISASQD